MGKNKIKHLFILSALALSSPAWSQATGDLQLEDPEDIKLLLEEFPEVNEAVQGGVEQGGKVDELEALKEDLGDMEFALPLEEETPALEQVPGSAKPVIVEGSAGEQAAELIFDVGKEEKELLKLAEGMRGKIPADEWNEIAQAARESSYTVRPGDWLWKISEKLFGSGFYYSKIWALNPYITNPHLIEPGMVLTFDTGSQDALPQIRVKGEGPASPRPTVKEGEFAEWGAEAEPDWLEEKRRLKEQGVYIQYSSAETMEDLKEASAPSLVTEYEAYEPQRPDFLIEVPADQYDESGFDRLAKVSFDVATGFYLNTFISTNVVQDFGKVDAAIENKRMFTEHDRLYVRFDDNINVVPGDKFSIYTAKGASEHENSDREGFKYTIVGSFQTVRKMEENLWQVDVIESAGIINRGDRITVYTPKIERITTTFNPRLIEAVVMSHFEDGKSYGAFGDVVYLDRGRADGVEIGNVFEVYGFEDRGTHRKITPNPTYKNGELTVISLTDNFATALVTRSVRDFKIGDIAVSKTKEAAARQARLKEGLRGRADKIIEDQALEELDVELNLENINDDLLEQADKIQFTEDELNELERQEREKSIMSEEEKDLKALERLENEIEEAEKMLKDSKLDEDKWLEQQSLDKLEKDLMYNQQESLDEIEENFGKRYLDERLNEKENPYGLTEFDIEEIDELLNVMEEEK